MDDRSYDGVISVEPPYASTSHDSPGRVRVLLVDDNPDFLKAAGHFLASDPQIEIIGLIQSGQEAVQQTETLKPDLVLMDLIMPEMDGLAATRLIKAQHEAPRVVIMTLYDDAVYRSQAEAVLVDEFISKSEFGTRLLPLIHSLVT